MNDDLDSDFQYAREVFKDLINTGQSAIADMLSLADQTQHPRAYESLALMLKSVSDTTKTLIDLHKNTKEIRKSDTPELPGVTNNNLFVGSTAELQKLLKRGMEEKPPAIDSTDYTEHE